MEKIGMHKTLLKAIWHLKALQVERERLHYFVNYGMHSGEDLASDDFKLKRNKAKVIEPLDKPISFLYTGIDEQARGLGYGYKSISDLEKDVIDKVRNSEEPKP